MSWRLSLKEIVARQGQLSAEIEALEKLGAEQLERYARIRSDDSCSQSSLAAAEMEATGRAAEEDQHLEELKNLINDTKRSLNLDLQLQED